VLWFKINCVLLHFAPVFSSRLFRITVITNIFCWSQRVRYNRVRLYIFIAILCVKMSRVNKALQSASQICRRISLLNLQQLLMLLLGQFSLQTKLPQKMRHNSKVEKETRKLIIISIH